jgi:phytoene dehydrogenase-like protein
MIVVVGAGLAGLAAAITLKKQGQRVLVLEATDRPGGRVRTFRVQPIGGLDRGYLLDRGFQVVLESYPAVQEFFDVEALEPRYFASGAILATDDGFFRLSNPLRDPREALAALATPCFSMADKLRLVRLGLPLLGQSAEWLAGRAGQAGEPSTGEFLRQRGFSEESLRNFFRPFFGGVLLDASLQTSSGLFLFYLQQFLRGRVFIPRRGIGELGVRLAEKLAPEELQLHAPVIRVRWLAGRAVAVQLADGREIALDGLIVATEEPASARLLPDRPRPRPGRPVWTFYFSTVRPVVTGAMLVLNGRGGPVAHLAQLTNLEPEWAPEGRELITATVNDDGGRSVEELQRAVEENLRRLFPGVDKWEPVGQAIIDYAVPQQEAGFAEKLPSAQVGENVQLAGDQVGGASLQGALSSGREAALSLLRNHRQRS